MIPLKLQIQNFLSYGPELQTINFASYKLMCLSGKNGHGKSALLDAMTWAIWGMARKIAGGQKADNGLLRLGQTAMKVIFDFTFNNTNYRIRREYAHRYGKPWAQLEFGIIDQKTDRIRPLTDKTIRATQEKIIQTLKLDYEAFINSAFLRQGNSNEFSMKSAKDRKEILGSILGLDEFEDIKRRALEKVKLTTNTLQTHETIQASIVKELEQLPELKEQVACITHERTVLEQALTKNTQKMAQLDQQAAKLVQEHTQYDQIMLKKNAVTQEIQKRTHDIHKLAADWRSVKKQAGNQQDMRALLTSKELLTNKIYKHQQTLTQNLQLKQKRIEYEQKRHELNQKFDQEFAQQITADNNKLHELSLAQAEKKQHTQYYEKQLKEYQAEQAELEKRIAHDTLEITMVQLTQKIACQTEQFEKRKETYYSLKSRIDFLEQTKNELEKKIDFTHNAENPSCPLCEQNISAARKKYLRDIFKKQLKTLTHQLSRMHTAYPELKEKLIKQHKELEHEKTQQEQLKKQCEKNKEAREKLQKVAIAITEHQKQICTFTQEQDMLEKTYAQLSQKLAEQRTHYEKNRAHHPEMKTLLAQLHELDTQIAAAPYHEKIHKQDAHELAAIEKQIAQLEQLRESLQEQSHRRAKISELTTEIRTLKKEAVILEHASKPFNLLPERKKNLEKERTDITQESQILHTKKEAIIQQHAHIQAEYARLEKRKAEQVQYHALVKDLKTTIEEYQLIAQAVSKNGVQALLIEHVIPEIESEANNLLAKLTDNQTHIIIDSLRDLKKGGTRETLDIKVSDPLGIRPYELFSGGEAFRIDFALRIAISKLLARRAGTSLQTLIIDEGFGSQDEEGLSHIMDAIHRIQDDFAKIIIVSHLTHMKEQFPVHFIIEKQAQGSKVTVIEH